eukprot:GHVN01030044.1.p1 GENE.GHVN01030044.1~~GHVN01030044.1.p1  ORF type:complete len:321 (-),score=77.98 GHVN01030044.1:1022-1984(-)
MGHENQGDRGPRLPHSITQHQPHPLEQPRNSVTQEPQSRQSTRIDFASTYLSVMAFGVVRGALRMPLEHPFDVVKTYWQCDPSLKGSRHAAAEVYREYGWKGFYSGGLPAAVRFITKDIYRWPLMIYLPPLVEQVMDKKVKKQDPSVDPRLNHTKAKLVTGLMIANIECVITSPLELIKVKLISRHRATGRVVIASLFTPQYTQPPSSHLSLGSSPYSTPIPPCQPLSHQSGPSHSPHLPPARHPPHSSHHPSPPISKVSLTMMEGLSAYYLRQNLSWGSFLVLDSQFKRWARRWSGADKDEALSFSWLTAVALGGKSPL